MTNSNLKRSTEYGLLYLLSDYCIRFGLLYSFRIIVFVTGLLYSFRIIVFVTLPDYCIRYRIIVCGCRNKEIGEIFVHMNEKWVGLWRVNGRELVAIKKIQGSKPGSENCRSG